MSFVNVQDKDLADIANTSVSEVTRVKAISELLLWPISRYTYTTYLSHLLGLVIHHGGRSRQDNHQTLQVETNISRTMIQILSRLEII